MDKIVITKYNDTKLLLGYENDKLESVDIDDNSANAGDIYVGEVVEYAKNINAFFVKISPNEKAFLRTNNSLKCGDKLLVQVKKEKTYGKSCVVSDSVNLNFDYVVLDTSATGIGVSKKIDDNDFEIKVKSYVNSYLADRNIDLSEFQLIIRTCVYDKYLEDLNLDFLNVILDRIIETYNDYSNKAKYLKAGTKIYDNTRKYESFDCEIVTDQKDLYDDLKDNCNVRFYDDDYSLIKLYNIERDIKKLLEKKVWLKSGANIVIEQTEALTSIDINSAKYEKGNNSDETFYKVNLEATSEIIRQIKLREISGIIIVDYINMTNKDLYEKLEFDILKLLENIKSDVTYVGFTRLGLCEFTRKKSRASLSERWERIDG